MAEKSLIGMIRDGLLGEQSVQTGGGVEVMPAQQPQVQYPEPDAYAQQAMVQEASQLAMQDNLNKAPQNYELSDFAFDEGRVKEFGVSLSDLNEGLQAFKGVWHGIEMVNDIDDKKSKGIGTTKEESFFDQVADGAKKMFGNEEKMLSLALAFNTMRMTPDQGLASHLSNRLKTIRENKSVGQSADSVMKALAADGSPIAKKYAQMVMNNPKMVKEIYSAYIKESGKTTDKFETGSGSYLSSKLGLTGLNPQAVYKYNTSTGELSQVSAADKPSSLEEEIRLSQTPEGRAYLAEKNAAKGTNVSIDLGKANQEQYKSMNQAFTDYQEQGVATRDSMNNLNRYVVELNNLMQAGGATGAASLTKKDIYGLAQRFGIPFGEEELAKYDTLNALTSAIVSTELRKNKGTQTNFDAEFLERTLPSLGKSVTANQAIIKHLQSVSTLKNLLSQASIIGRPAVLLGEGDLQNSAKLLNDLKLLETQLPSSFIDRNGNDMHFDAFYQANIQEGNYQDQPLQMLQAWKRFTREEAR